MDRQAWLERRRKGIGGTDAAAILGLSKYRTAVDVWEDKTGRAPAREVSAPMRWGLLLEDAIAAAYREDTGRRVRKAGGIRKHPRLGFVIGSPDRIATGPDGDRLVEIKTSRSDDGFAPKGAELDVEPHLRVPPAYYVQVQHYMGLLDLELADVAVLFGGSDFRIYPIPLDREYVRELYAEEGLWWNEYVVADQQPPVGPDDDAFLRRKYPRDEVDEIVATAEIAATVDRILELRDGIDALERERDGLEARVKDYLADAGRLVVSGASVTWRANDRTTVGWKEVAEAYRRKLLELSPAIARPLAGELEAIESLYTRTVSVRPFRIARKKEA